MLDGHPLTTGAVLSFTVTVNVQVELLPAASVNVYVTGVEPKLKLAPDVCVLVEVIDPPQLSIAVGAVHVAIAKHEASAESVMLDGHPLTTGAVLSITVTVNVQVELLPAASVNVYVTGVEPKEKVAPDVCVLVGVTEPLQLSVAVGAVHVATCEHVEALALLLYTVMLDGHPLTTGAVLSFTVTVNVQVELLPAASVNVYVTGVEPKLKVAPDVCVLVGVIEPPQLSIAVGAVHVAIAEHEASAESVILDGHPLTTGAVLSITVTVNVQVVLLPAASVNV